MKYNKDFPFWRTVFPNVPQRIYGCAYLVLFGNAYFLLGMGRGKGSGTERTELRSERGQDIESNGDVVLSQFGHKEFVG